MEEDHYYGFARGASMVHRSVEYSAWEVSALAHKREYMMAAAGSGVNQPRSYSQLLIELDLRGALMHSAAWDPTRWL